MPFANAERVAVDKLIALPDDISFETAAAALLQGLGLDFAQVRPAVARR